MKAKSEQFEMAEQHLTASELRLLLDADEAREASSGGFLDAAGHLERCETCRSRLTTLAAEPSWWGEAQSILGSEQEARWEPDLSQSQVLLAGVEPAQQAVHDQVLRLLGAPNHPEMLGRLGRYDIEKVIGSGGMGVVLKAHDSELNRPIAIKILAPHLSHVAAARERFAREGRAAAAVVHEHVVAIHNVEADGTLPFLVMQYVPGRSLQMRVDEDGPLGVDEILRIGMQAAAGLAAAHAQGLVHRDVKPSNILLEDTVERAVLTDFGLARAIDDASLTQTGVLAGTPHYMSPEQATGDEIDHRSDLFSLGAVLYFMATGHPPFRAAGALAVLHRICRAAHRPVWQWNKEIPDELSDVIDELLEKKAARRIATAAETRDRLATLLSQAQQHGLGRRRLGHWRSKRVRRKLIAVVVSALVLLTGAVGGAWLTSRWREGAGTGIMAQETDTAAANEQASSFAVEQLSAAARLERDFVAELNEVHDELRRASESSAYLQGQDAIWRQEVESIEERLDALSRE